MSSINLLPPNIKKEIEQTKINKKLLHHLYRVIILMVLVLFFATIIDFYFKQNIAADRKELDQKMLTIEKYGNLENEARVVSEKLNEISKIEKGLNSWSSILEEINTVMPSGAYLSAINLDQDSKNRNKITGFADSKNTVAFLRTALENSEKFKYVNIESSSIVFDPAKSREVENFIITFSLSKGALHE